MSETNIVALHDHTPQRIIPSLPFDDHHHPSLLLSSSLTLSSSSLNALLLVRINDRLDVSLKQHVIVFPKRKKKERKKERKIKFRVLYPNTKHPFPRGTQRQSKTPL